jgi:hypothetical protein
MATRGEKMNTSMISGKILFMLFIVLFLGGCATTPEVSNINDKTPPSQISIAPVNPPASDTTPEVHKTGYLGTLLAGDKTPLLDLNRQDYEEALSEKKVIFLYFYSSDNCPVCESDRKPLYDAFNEMSNSNIIGFRINYEDVNTDAFEEKLATDFDVEGPHTKIILQDGVVKQTVTSTWNKNDYINQITRYLE